MIDVAHTSDHQPRSNGFTREEWLREILHGGEVTRIGQHLALVIYHLSDPATNTAKLSARDLERITGWSKTAIVDHLAEIEVFIRVKWGAGRAKSLFELQGVIAEVLAEKKTVRQDATTVAIPAAETVSGNDPAAKDATTVATTDNGNETTTTVATNQACGNVAATKPEMGGTIGGENNNYPNKISLSPVPAQAPDWMISEDGGFEGQVFELSGADFAGLQQIYENLEWPAELVAADYFFAREFGKAAITPQPSERMGRLHQYLAKKNRDVRELRLSLKQIGGGKAERAERKLAPPTPAEQLSCWFDDEARLQVANGFKADLLAAVGGDEIRLREELDKAAGYVGVNTKGPQLMAKVRSRVTLQAQFRAKDRRAGSDQSAPVETKTEKRRQLVAATMEKLNKEGRPS